MNEKQLRGIEFYSKKDLINWLEANAKYIDWDFENVKLEFYWKDESERTMESA